MPGEPNVSNYQIMCPQPGHRFWNTAYTCTISTRRGQKSLCAKLFLRIVALSAAILLAQASSHASSPARGEQTNRWESDAGERDSTLIIQFRQHSAALESQGQEILALYLPTLRDPRVAVRIETAFAQDTTGARRLAWARGQAVRAWLMASGIGKDRVEVEEVVRNVGPEGDVRLLLLLPDIPS